MMTILKDVLSELFGMFLGDIRLSAAILAVVVATAGLIDLAGAAPLIGGGVLLAGCLAVVTSAVLHAARQKRASNAAAGAPRS